MIEFLLAWLDAIWFILVESGPYLLLGFLIAGFIKILIPEEKVFKHLGKDDFRSVFIASACGVPIPLCSCSVIPTAIALKRSGASKGATTAFLISTPETGVDSIGVTYALMDPLMTVARPLAALLTALGCGALVNFLGGGSSKEDGEATPEGDLEATGAECCDHEPEPEPEHDHEHDHGHDHDHDHDPAGGHAGEGVVRGAFRYAFGPLMADLTPWFILGFLLSGLITLLVPDDLLRSAELPVWTQMLAMLIIGVPLYICATASTPVAAALVAKGLDPGAALVFLLAGPATNVATWMVVKNFLGSRVLAIYLSGIAVSALALGFLVSGIYSAFEINPIMGSGTEEMSAVGQFIQVTAGVVLLALLVWYAVKDRLAARFAARLKVWCDPIGFDPTSGFVKLVLVVLLVGAWAQTAVTVVGPGETGFRTRFGGVRETIGEPSLVVHLPWPIETVEIVRDDEVRAVAFGERDDEIIERRVREAEGEVVTGNENLLSLAYSVQYRVRDAYRFQYGVDDPDVAVRAFTESSVRRMVAHRSSDQLLIDDRHALEVEALGILQADLDAVDAGIEAVTFSLIDIHSPEQTHYSYRDVASQLEYKEREILKAETTLIRRVTAARARAFTLELQAASEAAQVVERAKGGVASFVALQREHVKTPSATRFLLRARAMMESLKNVRLVLPLDPGIKVVPIDGAARPPSFEDADKESSNR